MKTPSALLAGICSLFLALHAPAQAKIEKAEALPALLKDAETDSIQYIERSSSFYVLNGICLCIFQQSR